MVILFARPYSAGLYVTVRAGTFGGVEYGQMVGHAMREDDTHKRQGER